jgi:hypothetical protein
MATESSAVNPGREGATPVPFELQKTTESRKHETIAYYHQSINCSGYKCSKCLHRTDLHRSATKHAKQLYFFSQKTSTSWTYSYKSLELGCYQFLRSNFHPRCPHKMNRNRDTTLITMLTGSGGALLGPNRAVAHPAFLQKKV